MKSFYSFFFIFAFLPSVIISQTQTDPLHGHYNIGSSDEIAMFWQSSDSGDKDIARHQIFDYYGNSGQYYIDSAARGAYTGDLGASDNGGYHSTFDAITGDFNGDGYDNIVAAWEGQDSSIIIVIPKNIDKKTLSWNDENKLILSDVLYPDQSNFTDHRFKLIKGYFDNDPEPEFALAFWNKEGNIEIRIFDVDPNTLVPTQKASIADVYNDPKLNNHGIFDIAAGDFDGDGRDEIVLVNYIERNENDWNISAKIYDYADNNGSFSLIPKATKDDFYTQNDFFDHYHRINDLLVATGDFKENTLDQFVVDFVLYRSGSETYNKLLPASVSMNLDTINVDLNNLKDIFQTLGSTSIGIGLLTGDINNDGKDEIIVDGDGRLNIYGTDSTLGIFGISGNNRSTYSNVNNRRRMFLADLDASPSDTVWNPELIVASTDYHQPDNGPSYTTLSLDVFEPNVDDSGNIIALNKRVSTEIDSIGGSRNYYLAVTAGDFDGGGISLGKPNYFSATDIVQPMVILNAPPTHFDVFNDTTFDVNKSYNGQVSNFFAEYYTSSESDIEVESELHKGWTVGGSAEGGFKIPKVDIGVKLKIEGEYGKNFSKQKFNKTTYRVSQNITANIDDEIYATIVDYDIWEYPIMLNDSIKGYTLVVSPKPPQKAWFPSKSPQAEDYLPDHEVGNILSYKKYATPTDNGALQSALRWNTSDEITLAGSPGFEYNWSLENENQSTTTNTEKVEWSIGASASFDIPFKFIPDIEIHGKYNQGSISTRTNTVTYKKGLDVTLGSVDLGIGETYYSVQPYAYWAKSGALVLDYAVNPRPSGINIPLTWWQERYGSKSDPALILPWRLDPQKGFQVSAEKQQQTKEIIFNPDDPAPGSTVNIQARIHNYSLLNTPGPVEGRFYLGDPNSGGTLMQSTDGETTFSTNDFIKAQDSKIISFNWQLPENLSFNPKIYVVLDPDNKIDEVHENNNVGWKVMNYSGTTNINQENIVPVEFTLSQNFPNPFNPVTTIEYSIAKSGQVTMKVYNILGREVKTLINNIEGPGKYKIDFNGSRFASGVYFYVLQSNGSFITKKFVLLK